MRIKIGVGAMHLMDYICHILLESGTQLCCFCTKVRSIITKKIAMNHGKYIHTNIHSSSVCRKMKEVFIAKGIQGTVVHMGVV